GIERGFRSEHVVMFDLAHDTEGQDPEALARTAALARQRVVKIPGVQSASVSGLLLFGRSDISAPLTIPGYSPAPEERPMARFNSVSPGYLETVGMTLVAGRDIAESDRMTAPLVAVVNEAM